MSDQVCRDLTAEGPVLTNMAAQWARVCLDESFPFKAHFHESMWTHVVLTDDSQTTMVPKMVNQADSSGVKAEIRQPRVPVSEVECSAWRKQVSEVLTSSSSTQNLSLVTQAIKNGYQFVDNDFKRLGLDPNVDVYVKEVCSMMGKKEAKFDKQSMAYKSLSSTNTMFRIITFIRMALETGKNLHESSVSSDDGSILPMFFKVMEKASEDLRLVTARLHGLSLRKVRGQVLEGSPFEKGDREKLVRATCLPSQYLFAGRLPDGEGFRDKDAQVARAKQEVERLERRKRFASNRPQGPPAKKPRFDQPSRGKYQSGYGSRQGGNNNHQFQDNRDKREPFRPSWRGGDRGGRGRGRGSGGEVTEFLENILQGQVGSRCRRKGVQNGVSRISTVQGHSQVTNPVRQGFKRSVIRRGSRYVSKVCYSQGPIQSPKRVLFKDISCPQEKWKMASCNKLKTTESVFEEATLQDVHPSRCNPGGRGRPLAGLNRPEGRVFSCAHPPVAVEIPEILCRGGDVRIQSLTLWGDDSSQNFHQDDGTGGRVHQKGDRIVHVSIPGRLLGERQGRIVLGLEVRKNGPVHARCRAENQLGEVRSNTFPGHRPYWTEAHDQSGHGIGSGGSDFGHNRVSQDNPGEDDDFSVFVSQTTGVPEQRHTSGGVGQIIHTANTDLSSVILETQYRVPGQSHSSPQFTQGSPEMVAEQGESSEGVTVVSIDPESGACDRREYEGLGSLSSSGRGNQGRMVASGEMPAVFRALTYFSQMWNPGDVVQVRSDNMMVVTYLNKQGGTRSSTLCFLTWDQLNWCRDRWLKMVAVYVQGEKNVLADLYSRKGLPHEWSLCPAVVENLFRLWGRPQVDLFASEDNAKLPLYCSLREDPNAIANDALLLGWDNMESYAYPPQPLIRRVLLKVKKSKTRMILVAPNWGRRPWMSILIDLLIDIPRALPIKEKLLKMPGQWVFHPDPQLLNLVAWRIGGGDSEKEAFEKELRSWQPGRSGGRQNHATMQEFESSWIGVTRTGLKIPLIPL